MFGTLSQDQINQILAFEAVGRIGCYSEGQIYIVPINYVYDNESIYGHSTEGLKLRMMRANPAVCFEVDHVNTMTNWQSVIAWGTFEELSGEAAQQGMQLLLDRFHFLATGETGLSPSFPGGTSSHRIDTSGRPAVIYRIRLTRKTGRFEQR